MDNNTRQKRKSAALVIRQPHKKTMLLVQRPSHDEALPNAWGLPAVSLEAGETFEEAAIRAGREKLGVETKILKEVARGEMDRTQYLLEMAVFEVRITQGRPRVPQPFGQETQYAALSWGKPEELIEAAKKGSLGNQLYLASVGLKW